MQQREALIDLSHRSYNEESQSRIKKSLQLPSSMKEFCKHEEEDDHIHATPSTQNPIIQDSVILQETIKKKCISCIETEKMIYEIQHELRSERKKNLRYLKIINNKMMKEKQLQTAYGQIAQELKKRMDAANAREFSMQSLARSYQKQAEQLRNSCQQMAQLDKKLTEANLKLKRADERYEELLKARQQIKENQQVSNGLSQLQIMNVFYEKQLVELHQKINTLESQMKLQEEELKYQKNIHRRQSADLPKEDGVKSANSIPQLVNHERTSNKSKPSDQNGEDSFRSSNIVKEGEMQAFKPFNMSKISSIDPRNDNSQLNDIVELNKEQSFNTVREWRSSEFHSIYHSQILQIHSNLLSFLKQRHSKVNQEMEANQSQYFTINSILFQNQLSIIANKSSQQLLVQAKQLQKQIEKDLSLSSPDISNSACRQVKGEGQMDMKQLQLMRNERDAVLRFAQTVRNLLEQVEISFKDVGKNQKLAFQMPRIPIFSQSKSEDGYKERIQELSLSSIAVEEATNKFQQHFQAILKMVKKSYERALNDQQLQLAELKSIISREDNEKQHLGKIVQKLQEHNIRLEYKISETEEASVSSNPIRDTYLRSVIKKKSSLSVSRFKEEFTQCQILASNLEEVRSSEVEDYQKIVNAVAYLPKFLNEILKKRQIDGGLSIDVEKDLQPQFEDIIKRSLTLLQIQISNYPKHSALKKLRRASFSTKQIQSKQDKSKYRQYIQLQTENTRLKSILKEKIEKVITLNEKNTFLNNQKGRLQKQIKQVQQKLQQDIKTLKLQLTQSKFDVQKRGGREIARNTQMMNDLDSQSGEFQAFDQKVEFNNLYQDKDEQLKTLKEKNQIYERELKKYKLQIRKRKKKVIYINN